MNSREYIEIGQLCDRYELELTFFSGLEEFELISIVSVEESRCVHLDEIRKIERMVRLHKDLDINIAGIEAVVNLLTKIETLQEELSRARGRLSLYENV